MRKYYQMDGHRVFHYQESTYHFDQKKWKWKDFGIGVGFGFGNKYRSTSATSVHLHSSFSKYFKVLDSEL
jgi:hypothetical protein